MRRDGRLRDTGLYIGNPRSYQDIRLQSKQEKYIQVRKMRRETPKDMKRYQL